MKKKSTACMCEKVCFVFCLANILTTLFGLVVTWMNQEKPVQNLLNYLTQRWVLFLLFQTWEFCWHSRQKKLSVNDNANIGFVDRHCVWTLKVVGSSILIQETVFCMFCFVGWSVKKSKMFFLWFWLVSKIT